MPAARKCALKVLRNPAWVAFTWLGMTAGVSLLVTPVRFATASLTRPVALDLSRAVFYALNKAEFIAFIIMLILVRSGGRAKELWAATSVLALILIAQSAWLIPALSARTDQILAGIEPASSIVHGTYSTLELSKLLILMYVGFRSMQELLPERSAPKNPDL